MKPMSEGKCLSIPTLKVLIPFLWSWKLAFIWEAIWTQQQESEEKNPQSSSCVVLDAPLSF